MQHFVVPSSGLGSQSQIITIPVNLLSQGNSQPISLVTSNGQIIQFQNMLIVKKKLNLFLINLLMVKIFLMKIVYKI